MNLEHLEYLLTDTGKQLLANASTMPADRLLRLTRLRKTINSELAQAIVSQLELRARARRKFALADEMLFTAEGLEQSTGETIARYRASRFPIGSRNMDICCGIGGDTVALSHRGETLAIDSNKGATYCTGHNLEVHGLTEPVVCADATPEMPHSSDSDDTRPDMTFRTH